MGCCTWGTFRDGILSWSPWPGVGGQAGSGPLSLMGRRGGRHFSWRSRARSRDILLRGGCGVGSVAREESAPLASGLASRDAVLLGMGEGVREASLLDGAAVADGDGQPFPAVEHAVLDGVFDAIVDSGPRAQGALAPVIGGCGTRGHLTPFTLQGCRARVSLTLFR